MITAEQIPLEVIAAAWDGLGANDDMRSAITTALNAWPDAGVVATEDCTGRYPQLILPLQEPRT
jgi:hypothetical protein